MSSTLPTILPIKKIIPEAEGIKTFVFEHELNAQPGQFVMLWLPRVDEKPFGVWTNNPKKFYVTVSAVGTFSEKLHKLKVGDKVGFRGPFGHGFTIPISLNGGINSSINKPKNKKHIVCIGGGFGVAPLLFLAYKSKDCEINFIIGARTKNLLFGEKYVRAIGANLQIATNDGSTGIKGFNVVILEQLLAKQKIDMVYTCGPELMMKRVAKICKEKNVACELSLERYMKCGFGVCGACAIDSTGWLACKNGPVISGEAALKLTEFGKYRRDRCGEIVKF